MISAEAIRKVEQTVAEVTGVQVSLTSQGDQILVSGQVDSDEQRDAVIDIVTSLLPDARVDDALILTVTSVDLSGMLAEDKEPRGALPPELESDDEFEDAMSAPTDPVVTLDAHGQVEILGGFSNTSLDDVDVDESSTGGRHPGDLALEDAVRRELREDAATTDLQIEVTVARGVVYLNGRVPGPEDVDNAESVAASVPGVRDVVEQLELGG